MINKIEKFDTFSKNGLNEEFVGGGKTFYKIIDKNKLSMWLKKDFIKDKKTMVTSSEKETTEINDSKTAVKISNVPANAVIDTEGNWGVIELYPVKNQITVEPIEPTV